MFTIMVSLKENFYNMIVFMTKGAQQYKISVSYFTTDDQHPDVIVDILAHIDVMMNIW